MVALILGLVLLVTACQTVPGPSSSDREAAFRELWDLYRHCQATPDLATAQRAAQALVHRKQLWRPEPDPLYAFIPQPLARYIQEPSLRLSVDPAALAVSCTLRAGHLALVAEELEIAQALFRRVVDTDPDRSSGTYAREALSGLQWINAARLGRIAPRHVAAPLSSPLLRQYPAAD